MKKRLTLILALILALSLSFGALADIAFTVTDATEQQNALGRCIAPANFVVYWANSVCGPGQSVSYPCQLAIEAVSEPDDIIFDYLSHAYFMAYDGAGSTRDGEFNTIFCMPVLHYMTAAEYCDYMIRRTYADMEHIALVREDNFPNLDSLLERKIRETLEDNTAYSLFGMSVDAGEATLCYRLYRMNYGEDRYYGAVLTGVGGIHISGSYIGLQGPVSTSGIQWQAPFVYMMLCPENRLEEAEPAFTQFCLNTGVSDQYLKANLEMRDALWPLIIRKNDLSAGRSFSTAQLLAATARGDDYDDERFTDYMFEQNDYTLSDGSHVKVSTRYDYVYEADGGVIATDSALSQPSGQRLYPNP